LRRLKHRWDVILIDTPPLMAVADARLLVSNVDATVLLVRWASTRREQAISTLNQLINAQANVAGVALTMVDVKKHPSYDFGDSGFYSRRVAGYTTKAEHVRGAVRRPSTRADHTPRGEIEYCQASLVSTSRDQCASFAHAW
jgi:Mrp family chromosome partitioning ATPase